MSPRSSSHTSGSLREREMLWKQDRRGVFPQLFLVLPNFHESFYLASRFHVAVRLFNNRTQMTSKCDKNNKVAHEAIAQCVTDVLATVWRLLCVCHFFVLTTFWRHLWSVTEQTHGKMESICFIANSYASVYIAHHVWTWCNQELLTQHNKTILFYALLDIFFFFLYNETTVNLY